VPVLSQTRVPYMTLSMCQTPPRMRSPDIRLLVFRPMAYSFLPQDARCGFTLVCPRVQVNTVKGNSLRANSNSRDVRPHFRIEAVFVHAQIARCIP